MFRRLALRLLNNRQNRGLSAQTCGRSTLFSHKIGFFSFQPLAEPDEVGDLSAAFVAAEGADKGKVVE